MKFFKEHTGRYCYKHKGSGVVCDMLMAIGKTFAQTVSQSLKKAVEKTTEKMAEKARKGMHVCPPPFFGRWEDYEKP